MNDQVVKSRSVELVMGAGEEVISSIDIVPKVGFLVLHSGAQRKKGTK